MKSTRKKNAFQLDLKALFSFAMALILFLFIPFSAFAMNLDYLDASKWENNANVTIETIDKTALGEQLFGTFGYYIDDSMCIYTYFSVTESSFTDERHEVRIGYDFHMPGEEYSLSVDADGICDGGDEEKRVFSASQNFDYESIGAYISAVQYLGKDKECTVDISFYANGHLYRIRDGLKMELPTTTKTTTASRTTTQRTTKPKTTRTTAKRAKTTQKAAVIRSTTRSTTKYTPTGTYNKSSRSVSAQASKEEAEETAVSDVPLEQSYESEEPQKSIMTSTAKHVLLLGIITAAIGSVLLIAAALSKERKKQE